MVTIASIPRMDVAPVPQGVAVDETVAPFFNTCPMTIAEHNRFLDLLEEQFTRKLNAIRKEEKYLKATASTVVNQLDDRWSRDEYDKVRVEDTVVRKEGYSYVDGNADVLIQNDFDAMQQLREQQRDQLVAESVMASWGEILVSNGGGVLTSNYGRENENSKDCSKLENKIRENFYESGSNSGRLSLRQFSDYDLVADLDLDAAMHMGEGLVTEDSLEFAVRERIVGNDSDRINNVSSTGNLGIHDNSMSNLDGGFICQRSNAHQHKSSHNSGFANMVSLSVLAPSQFAEDQDSGVMATENAAYFTDSQAFDKYSSKSKRQKF